MKSHRSLCHTCMMTCRCDAGRCEGYVGFRQMSIFDPEPKERYRATPRRPWEYYDITKERHKQLIEYIQSDIYAHLASQASREANKDIAEYILLSVKKNLSYDDLDKIWGRGDIERIPYCRTDFYGIRRYFIHLFDLEMRRIGK